MKRIQPSSNHRDYILAHEGDYAILIFEEMASAINLKTLEKWVSNGFAPMGRYGFRAGPELFLRRHEKGYDTVEITISPLSKARVHHPWNEPAPPNAGLIEGEVTFEEYQPAEDDPVNDEVNRFLVREVEDHLDGKYWSAGSWDRILHEIFVERKPKAWKVLINGTPTGNVASLAEPQVCKHEGLYYIFTDLMSIFSYPIS